MVLVDTSIWVDHFRRGHAGLIEQLEEGAVLCHPFVIGELACGNLHNRIEVLDLLQALPMAPVADQDEVLHLLQEWRLFGQSLGWVDAHLLASARLMGYPIWTLDKSLAKAAGEINQAF
ncbi:MAG: VapC toxin family PIN domain ribonuclease [Verrucomicrobia bacterium]|nr:MAG: VapC toxin family PIN domain ribonuclease [Verrucomicrobiota bacterium]